VRKLLDPGDNMGIPQLVCSSLVSIYHFGTASPEA
jgi:hypothetical protein